MAVDQRGPRGAAAQVVHHPQQADDRCRVDVATRRLVVEAHVAADDRDAEGPTGPTQAVDGLGELPHHLGVLGIAEVEAVDDGQGPGAHAGQVQDRLGDYQGRAGTRVHGTPPMVAVGAHGQAAARLVAGDRVAELEHGGVVARADHGVQKQLVVILAVHPGRVGQQVQQVGPRVGGGGQVVSRRTDGAVGGRAGTVVEGGVLVERGGGHLGQHLAVETVEDAQRTAVGDPANDGGRHLPALADGQHAVQALGLHDGQHPLLGLAGHDLVGLHAGLPSGHG